MSCSDRIAQDEGRRICRRAFEVIRASAFRREPVDAPAAFDGDFAEWIRLVADACDGLVETDAEGLVYRRSVWNDTQRVWVESTLADTPP